MMRVGRTGGRIPYLVEGGKISKKISLSTVLYTLILYSG